jgi:hypothetical protein
LTTVADERTPAEKASAAAVQAWELDRALRDRAIHRFGQPRDRHHTGRDRASGRGHEDHCRISIDERAAAAGWTATHDPLCATATSNSPMTPFYWEIGDEDATHARSGFAGIGAPGNGDPMAIASASKWVYAA